MEASGPRLIQYADKSALFSIWDLADIHWGNEGCSKTKLRSDVNVIKTDPYSFWFLGGDYCDFIAPNDKRFDPECVDKDMKVYDLARLASHLTFGVVSELMPIKDKCLGALYGNHEHKYMKNAEHSEIHDEVCEQLEVQNMRYCGITDIWFEHNRKLRRPVRFFKNPDRSLLFKPNQTRLRVLVHHGFGAANTAGGRINALVKEMGQLQDVDLVIMGHLHEILGKVTVRLMASDDCSAIHQVCSVGMLTGSYLKSYDKGHTSYAEVKGYSPNALGATRATFSPLYRELEVRNKAIVGHPHTV